MKTVTVTIDTKEPDVWAEVIDELGLSSEVARDHFEHGEYATIELTIAEDLTFTGRILGPDA